MRTHYKLALLLAGGLLSASYAQAQNSKHQLKDIESFSIGLTMQYLETKDSLSAGSAGEGITWDFSAFKAKGDTLTQEILKAEAMANHKNYPNANIVERTSDGKVLFIEKTAAENKLWGIEQPQLNMQYTIPYTFIRRPFAFKDSISSSPARSYDAYGGFKGQGKTSTVADGFGMLVLPTGKFQHVMRVKFEQEFVEQSAASGTMTTHIVTYGWFTADRPGALFRMSTVSIKSQYYNAIMHSTDMLLSENGKAVMAGK